MLKINLFLSVPLSYHTCMLKFSIYICCFYILCHCNSTLIFSGLYLHSNQNENNANAKIEAKTKDEANHADYEAYNIVSSLNSEYCSLNSLELNQSLC